LKILLLDAYNLIHRARSGYKKGEYPVIYNFFRGIRPIIEKFNPDKVYFVLEGNPKFRTALSEGNYKSNRVSPGDSFHRQKASIINMVSGCLPFDVVKHPDLECDDVIATMCAVHCKQGDVCTIISSDSDFIQLLNVFETVSLYNPIKKAFFEKPDYDYVTWKALRGDLTDNIRGIPGVGDKTATKLVTNLSSLSDFLKDNEKLSIFEKNVNLIRLVDFSNDLSVLEYSKSNKDFNKLKSIFENMGFSSIIKEKSWDKYINTFKGLK
jgi:DNA polymerase-1